MSHFSRKPVRFIDANQELLDVQKSVSGDQARTPGTDIAVTESAMPVSMEPQYRTAPDRVNGNTMFRRYPDGQLDYGYAKNKVVDAVHRVRDGVPLTSLEQTALSCLFPVMFSYVDGGVSSAVRRVNLKISDAECAKVALLVSSHLAKEIEFMLASQAR